MGVGGGVSSRSSAASAPPSFGSSARKPAYMLSSMSPKDITSDSAA